MAAKSEYLQIRVTSEQKATLRRSAKQAGQGLSEYVLSRVLPQAGARFAELMRALEEGKDDSRFVLAELNDLLSSLAPVEFGEAIAEAPPGQLSPYLRNYIAAMVELAAYQKNTAPPAWPRDIEPLEQPHFATPSASLRPHLLHAAPVPFRRRNIFVDSTVGDRI